MHQEAILSFTLFGRQFGVHLYGLMIAIGILVCIGVLYLYGRKKNIDPSFIDFLFYDGILSIVLGFVGATLYQSFYNYLKDPSAGFHIGGMTFLGGLIVGAAVCMGTYFLFRKRLKGRFVDVVSILPCCILIAHGFGRIGCFFAGCCYGKDATGFFSFLGVSFPKGSLANWHGSAFNIYDGTPVYPTMLFEAAFLFIMFGVCTYLLFRKDYKQNLALYLVSYAVFRFLIEYIRGDERGKFIFSFLSPSQFQSIGMLAIGIVLFIVMPKFFKKREEELALQNRK